MTLTNYQFQFDVPSQNPSFQLVFGDQGALNPGVDLISVKGLFDHEIRDDDRESSFLFGDFSGIHRPGPRYITLELEIRGDPTDQDYHDLVQATRDIFGPHYGVAPLATGTLTWKWIGEPEKFIRCRPVRRREPRDSDTEYGLVKMEVMLKAADPRIYSTALNSASSGPFVNDGNTWAFPIITVTPSGNNATVTNSTNGTVAGVIALTGSGNVVFDFDAYIRVTNGLYVYRGANDGYPFWNHPRVPLMIDPGSNSIAAGVGTLVSIQWRDTWL